MRYPTRDLPSLFLALVALLAVLVTTASELDRSRHFDDLPRWDMAKYGAAGARMAERIDALDLPGLLGEINALGSWPPGFPLLLAPAFLLFETDVATARALVALGFGGCLLAFGWVALALDRRHGLALALLVMAWMATSPMHRLFAGLVMLEIPGTFFGLVALGAYLRAIERPWRRGWWHLCGATSLALFFTKYNYGLLWLAPLAFAELWRRSGGAHHGGVRRLLALATRWSRRIDLTRPWHLFLIVYLGLLASLHLGGGIDTELAGLELRATSLGNPTYGLYALILLRALLAPRRSHAWCRARWQRLDSAARILVAWIVAPTAVWMAIPPHLKDFFGFVENRSSGLDGLEAWLYYPRALSVHYAPWPWLGGIVLALAGLGLVWSARQRPVDRPSRQRRLAAHLLLVMSLIALVAVVGHPYKLPRFLFTVMPLLWLAAALAVVTILHALSSRGPSLRASRSGASRSGASRSNASRSGASRSNASRSQSMLLTAAGLALALVLLGLPVARQRALAMRAAHSVTPETNLWVEEILDRSRAVPGRTLVLGTWNLLSPGLLEWRALGEGLPVEQRPIALRSLGRKSRRALVGAAQILVLEPQDPMSPPGQAMVADTHGEQSLSRELLTSPEWTVVSRIELDTGMYRLLVLQATRTTPTDR